MNDRTKTISAITIVAVLGFALMPDANAGSVSIERGTGEPIQSCVAEIGKHADYVKASRVVHRISALNQRNLIEMEITVETSVYLNSGDAAVRQYTASCVTDPMGALVKFHIDGVVVPA